ncbi:MAG: group II intron reverse transcriptase/maturase [Armatimonadetes bacterium]|nr:group II intron reverse transcriptase/maturase [Armatimonadota bacterium]
MQTSLQGIAKKAEREKRYRFRNLYGMLNEEMLRNCWRDIRKNAAYGVDKVSAQEYGQNLEENIRQLVERLKRKRYRARLVRRHYIPKGGGKLRPLGIPATEDKLLQLAVTRILTAIYEQDFLRCSYGYRPNVGALDAVDKLTIKLQFGRYNYVVESDIKGFFDNIDHEWMIKMLAERIDDRALLWLIKKWLKAGVLDTDGKVLHPVTGTPQGGIVSPILANVYLHYALDLWFEKVVKRRCGGEACLIRYADDYVCAFQCRADAERFYEELGPRLGKFGVELSEEKTQVIPFDRCQPSGGARFEFLGFEFYWGKDRLGKAHLKRRTSRKKLRSSLKRLTEWCKKNRNLKLTILFKRLNIKLRGYYNYYGVYGNFASLKQFFEGAMRILMKWLNRRSQRYSYNWVGFRMLIEHFRIERPRIVGRPRQCRVSSSAEAVLRKRVFLKSPVR